MSRFLFLIAICPLPVFSQSIIVEGKFDPSNYTSFFSFPKHHHFIVWEDGSASSKALITTNTSDSSIQRKLQILGAIPGNNLTLDTWNKRKDKNHPDPKINVAGTTIKVEIFLNDQWLNASDIFETTKPTDFHFKLGGHLRFISEWNSGCVVCLQSCPGGRISNASTTISEWEADLISYPLKPEINRLKKQPVKIKLTVKK